MCELDVLQNIEDCKLCGCFGGSFRVYTSDIVGDYILMGKSDTLKHLNNIKESGEKYKKYNSDLTYEETDQLWYIKKHYYIDDELGPMCYYFLIKLS